jgi:hypothetical protein
MPSEPRHAWAESLLLAGIVIATGWFYLWTALPESTFAAEFSRTGSEYYSLLTRGFLKGQLSLDKPADPFLATLKDPWDNGENAGHGMHDASYYRGRYYLYFGVTPAIVLFLPVRLLSGLDIGQSLASVVFAWVGLAASAWTIGAIRRRYFPGAPLWAAAMAVAALGLADTMALLLRRANIWEVPITCAYACFMVGLALLFAALHGRRRCLWLALASASFGLAVGARPTYLLGCAALLVPLFHWMRVQGGIRAALRDPSWRKAFLAAALPVCLVGLGLAAYNYGRFGSITEFGQRYQLAGTEVAKLRLFDWRYIPFGLRLYWLLPATWSPYFPFLSVAVIPPGPFGHMGAEDPYGILPNIPFCFLALASLALAVSRSGRARPGLAAFCRAVLVASAATAVTVACFGGVTNRYMVDFVPGFVLLSSIGLLSITSAAGFRGLPGAFGTIAAVLLFVLSAAFNVFASLRHNELFHVEHPALYGRMAHGWNRIPYAFDRWFHRGGYGDLELTVVFPRGEAGTNEPLVVTGNSFLADYLLVHYGPENSLSFGFEHTSHGAVFGDPIQIRPGVPHVVVVRMGSIYPPPGHPFFDTVGQLPAWLIQNRVRVTVDGVVALDAHAAFYDATSWEPSIGQSNTAAYGKRFSGKILEWHRVAIPDNAAAPGPAGSGPVRISLLLPAFSGVRSEPLVCSGERGRGDLLYVEYVGPGKIAFGFDHWGVGGPISPPMDVDPAAVQTITVDYGALHPQGNEATEGTAGTPGRLLVAVNGRNLLDVSQSSYRSDRKLVAIGDNLIGSSVAGEKFSGTLLGVTYLGR